MTDTNKVDADASPSANDHDQSVPAVSEGFDSGDAPLPARIQIGPTDV